MHLPQRAQARGDGPRVHVLLRQVRLRHVLREEVRGRDALRDVFHEYIRVNRTNCCHNCCNLCGPVSDNPIVWSSFVPQPENTEHFVAMAKQTIPTAQIMGR